MTTQFCPTQEDVERYRRLRAASDKLGMDIVRHIPEQAYDDIGEALGMLRDGVLVLDRHDMSGIMADCCLYDWNDADGRNVVEGYAATHPTQPGTDQHYVLNAFVHAKYRVLNVRSLVPGAGAHCEDLLHNEDLFIMDVGMSRNPVAGWVLATRTIPLGEYWMTGGTGLPITSPDIMENARLQFRKRAGSKSDLYPQDLSLSIVRACLDAGAANQIMHHFAKPKRREPRHIPRRNRHKV